MTDTPLDRRSRAGLIAAAIGGLAAAIAYPATVVIGGLIVPGYSHLTDSVSELSSPGAPFREALAVGFVVYNAGVVILGIGLRLSSSKHVLTTLGSALQVACGAAGVLMLEPFPQDPMGSAITFAGGVHIALAAVSALTLVAAAVLLGLGWKHDPIWRRLRVPSWIAAAAILLTGGVGAAMVNSPVFGLFERFTQLSFLTWFAVLGVTALSALRVSGLRPRQD